MNRRISILALCFAAILAVPTPTAATQGYAYGSQLHHFQIVDGALNHWWFNPPTGYPEHDVWAGPPARGRPAGYVHGNEQHVFATGTDDTLRHWWWFPGIADNTPGHDNWGAVGRVTSDPTGFAYYDQQHVFYRAPDGSLEHRWYDHSTGRVGTDNWGGDFIGTPVAYVFGDEQHVFARGADNTLRHWYWYPGIPDDRPGLDDWGAVGRVTSDPTGFVYYDQQHVFYRAPDGTLEHRFFDHGTWRLATDNWGGSFDGPPVAYLHGDEQHVFARGPNNTLRHWYWYPGIPDDRPGLDDWGAVGVVSSEPSGFAIGDEQHVFYVRPDGRLENRWWDMSDRVVRSEDWGPGLDTGRPHTIPALREWTAGGQPYQHSSDTRVVLDPSYAWADTGVTVADDFAALTGVRPEVVSISEGSLLPGDVYLTLGSTDAALGPEGYRLEVGPVIKIRARTVTGAFYGTRSVLQMLRQSATIPGGTARDWPSTSRRGVLIDTVPRSYSPTWWHNMIRDLSYVKHNDLSLMVLGVGLTDAEIADLTAFSRRYHVNLTPQQSLVSHAELFLERHPELRLSPGAPPPVSGAIDFTKPGALDILANEITSLIDRFPGKYWHAGGDEYLVYPNGIPNWQDYPQLAAFARAKTGNPNATGSDAFRWYLNWLDDLVNAHGKTLRVWNDHIERPGVVALHSDIEIDFWERQVNNPVSATAQDFAGAGHMVVNWRPDFLYYDNGWRHPDPARIYESFGPAQFHDGTVVSGDGRARLGGAQIAVWMAVVPGRPNESSDEMAANLFAPLRSLAQVTWGSPKPMPYYGTSSGGFARLINTLGRAPGWQG